MDVSAGIVKFRVSGAPIDGLQASHLLPAGLAHEGDTVALYAVHAFRSKELAFAEDAQAGSDIVVLKIAGGPVLVLHPDSAKALLTAETPATRDQRGDTVPVTAHLPWSTPSNDVRSDVPSVRGTVLQWFGIVRCNPLAAAAQNAATQIAERIDARVREGLYRLQPGMLPESLVDVQQETEQSLLTAGRDPLLILVHGTFVATASTFGKLWEAHGEIVRALFDRYEGRVFAFDHPTLRVSPVGNALALARALPENAVIDLLTHSRGGLVAEILVRASARRCNRADVTQHFGAPDEADVAALLALHEVLRRKNITVRRVVRVACPARGTLLASGRLDAYLSVFHWLITQAQLHISALVFDFLREIALQGTQPEVLPGIAAMRPSSPLVNWLNAPLEDVDSGLFVLAGDLRGESVLGWLKTLVADAFYWTDNDLVVQTRSMYGGVPRSGNAAARFMRFEGEQISHFDYFSFHASAQAVDDALQAVPRADWKLIGPFSQAGQDAGGLRDVAPAERTLACAFVIPGFLGSHLALAEPNGRRIWLTGTSPVEFGLLDPQSGVALKPDGLVMACYGKLCERLGETHEVLPFAYDWRQPLDQSAEQLAVQITRRLDDPAQRTKPLRFIAHGMGGLVLRVLHLNHRTLWKRMMALEATRILMLGVPQHGCWVPLQALSGDDAFDNILAGAGPLFGARTTREILARMPGFIQMQAGIGESSHNLRDRSGWEALQRTELNTLAALSTWHSHRETWAIPDQASLDAADRLWRKLHREADAFAADADKIVLVAGSAPFTPSGVKEEGSELLLECVSDGDGRVTLDSARLANNKVWRIKAQHGRLPMALPAFNVLMALLTDDKNAHLEEDGMLVGSASRSSFGTSAACKPRPFHHGRSVEPPGDLATWFDVHHDEVAARSDEQLTVRVHHSDLRFIRVPLIVGHYQSMSLTGSEAVVDGMVNERMSKALRAGIYPERVGSYQIFENGQHIGFRRQKPRFIPRPRAAIVVGLGEEGKLSAQHLSYTLRIGILAYAERLAESASKIETFKIAATLVGSGGFGITIGNAVLALVQAITDANQKLKETGWPRVSDLEIVEMYLDRATDAWRVLTAYASTNSDRLVVEKNLIEGEGRKLRPLDASYRGTAYDFISAVRVNLSNQRDPVIAYSLDTKRARTEVKAQQPQNQLVRDLVAKASNASQADPLIGRTLFNLLVPVEIEPFFAGSTDMVMELDEYTAALPWEMLETGTDSSVQRGQSKQPPWAIRSKVIRKMQTGDYRGQLIDASVDDNILIIGQPKVANHLGPLPGAQREAESIAKAARNALGSAANQVTLLAQSDEADAIINQLFARNYRMVHIAGHGTGGVNGGVILSGNNTFLGGNEIEAMRVTPELVFINCCHLAQIQRAPDYDRVSFASSIAMALIKIGVRCVVAAGWAVDDIAAEKFANTFYTALFNGARFIDAVGEARKAAWEAAPGGNTWAAYQCYGDPDWNFRTTRSARMPSPKDEYAGIASPSTLILVLESIKIDAMYATPQDCAQYLTRLRYLEDKCRDWQTRGDVAEAFGNAYAVLSERVKAQEWFERARDAGDGSASLQAVQLLAEQQSLPGAKVDDLKKAIGILRAMVDQFKPTLPRLSLLGNAYKRLSVLLNSMDTETEGEADASLECAIKCFTEATKLPHGGIYLFYPPRAILECELRRLLLASNDDVPLDWREAEMAKVEQITDRAAHDDPNFWSIVAQTQIDIMKAIMRRRLHLTAQEITRSFADLKKRIATQWFWNYVQDDVRFLLVPYLERLDDGQGLEREAAQQLMTQLDGFCKRSQDAGS